MNFSQSSLKLTDTTSFGAAFTSFYRLFGPFRSSTSSQVIKTELWDTIVRRGFLGNLTMGLIPMLFYLTLNSIVYVVAQIVDISHSL